MSRKTKASWQRTWCRKTNTAGPLHRCIAKLHGFSTRVSTWSLRNMLGMWSRIWLSRHALRVSLRRHRHKHALSIEMICNMIRKQTPRTTVWITQSKRKYDTGMYTKKRTTYVMCMCVHYQHVRYKNSGFEAKVLATNRIKAEIHNSTNNRKLHEEIRKLHVCWSPKSTTLPNLTMCVNEVLWFPCRQVLRMRVDEVFLQIAARIRESASIAKRFQVVNRYQCSCYGATPRDIKYPLPRRVTELSVQASAVNLRICTLSFFFSLYPQKQHPCLRAAALEVAFAASGRGGGVREGDWISLCQGRKNAKMVTARIEPATLRTQERS